MSSSSPSVVLLQPITSVLPVMTYPTGLSEYQLAGMGALTPIMDVSTIGGPAAFPFNPPEIPLQSINSSGIPLRAGQLFQLNTISFQLMTLSIVSTTAFMTNFNLPLESSLEAIVSLSGVPIGDTILNLTTFGFFEQTGSYTQQFLIGLWEGTFNFSTAPVIPSASAEFTLRTILSRSFPITPTGGGTYPAGTLYQAGLGSTTITPLIGNPVYYGIPNVAGAGGYSPWNPSFGQTNVTLTGVIINPDYTAH